jgi:hypothetical protein
MFGFSSQRAKKGLRVPKGAHVLQEHELESSIGGGTPIRQSLYSVNAPGWLHNTMSEARMGEANYYRYAQTFPVPRWQSDITWETTDDII